MSCNGCTSKVSRAASAIAHGATGIAKALLGVDPVTKEVRDERIAICKACEFAAPGKINRDKKVYCGKLWDGLIHDTGTCGCLISLKVLVASESCPVGRWPAVSPAANNDTGVSK